MRSGSPSAFSSDDKQAGTQYCRISAPIGVPGSVDRYHSMSAIFKCFSPSLILFSTSGGVMERAIDEDADAGDRAALIVEIRLNEDVGDRSVLGEIWKTNASSRTGGRGRCVRMKRPDPEQLRGV
jgi:hypothetical protein